MFNPQSRRIQEATLTSKSLSLSPSLPPCLSSLTPTIKTCVCVIISSFQRRKQKFRSPNLGTKDHTAGRKRYVADNIKLPRSPWPFGGSLSHRDITPSSQSLRLCPAAVPGCWSSLCQWTRRVRSTWSLSLPSSLPPRGWGVRALN